MGTNLSKSTATGSNEVEKDVVKSVSTSSSINTPEIRRLDLDPRSPSSDIPRTPIEVLKTPNMSYTISKEEHTISTDLNNSSDCGTSSPSNGELNGTCNANIVLRSHVHNKILDNARRASLTLTPIPTKPKRCEKIIKNLNNTAEAENIAPSDDLSNIQPCINPENKRASIVGLLETNIDFVETDLDAVIQHKIQEQMEIPYEINQAENIEDNPIHTDDIPRKNIEEILNEPPLSHESTEPTEETNSILLYVDTKSSVNELNRKLTDLIYQDKELDEQPRVITPKQGHHTPLKDRNYNGQQSKSIPKLKVSDKPTKNTRMSKIPVIKDKHVKAKPTNQCENTPPIMRPKRSEWSIEDSLII